MSETLTFDIVKQAVAGHGAAFRGATEYQPAGGVGEKVFPPTYEGGRYAGKSAFSMAARSWIACCMRCVPWNAPAIIGSHPLVHTNTRSRFGDKAYDAAPLASSYG